MDLNATYEKTYQWFLRQPTVTRYIIVFFGGLSLWMFSGVLLSETPPKSTAPPPPLVQIQASQGEKINRTLRLEGQVRPNRSVLLKAQTSGTVLKLPTQKGAIVQKDDILVELAPDDRLARLQEAHSNVQHYQMEYKTAKKLGKQGFQSENRVAQTKASLDKAKAQLAIIQKEIRQTTIKAPFAGILQDRPVEKGDTLSTGDPIAQVIELNPLLFVGYIPQDQITQIRQKEAVTATLRDGTAFKGNVRYVSAYADPQTRTYTIEIEAPNPENKPLAGSSVVIDLPLKKVLGHKISPAFLSLSTQGVLGVKTLGAENTVVFAPVSIEKTTPDGIWVGGLPPQTTIITLGHGFVNHGQKVRTKASEATHGHTH